MGEQEGDGEGGQEEEGCSCLEFRELLDVWFCGNNSRGGEASIW